MKRYHYIYRTTHIETGRYYIGVHSTNNLEDGYLGSGIILRNLIRAYEREDFHFEILKFFEDRKSAFLKESEIVNENLLEDPLCLNLCKGGEGGDGGPALFGPDNGMFGNTHTQKVRKKLGIECKKRFKGKSYEELYGSGKAKKLKEARKLAGKESRLRSPYHGSKNPNFNSKIYIFTHESGITFTGLQSELLEKYNLDKSGISMLIHGRAKTTSGWRLK